MAEYFTNVDEKVAFFLNAYNFLVLFALCKLNPKEMPLSFGEWNNFLRSVKIQLNEEILTGSEIEHCILRAKMSFPKVTDINTDGFKFAFDDPRINLVNPMKLNLLNFGLYWPCKYTHIYIYIY